jgi:hypothetical protein
LSGGAFSLPDGSQAIAGDRINLPEDAARKFAERGVANIVEHVPIEGNADLRLDLEMTAGGSANAQ